MGLCNSGINLLFVLFLCIASQSVAQKQSGGQQMIERADDIKDVKKILRTKNNVLALFTKNDATPGARRLLPILGEVAEKMYGRATVMLVNCGSEEGRKLCKKIKAAPEPLIIKHFHNGEFNKDYDRSETVDSFIRFLNDPTGELPWVEETVAKDVLHVHDTQGWMKLLRKEKLPILGMFYAPWCGYCKRLKPIYSLAATELKGTAILAGIDVTKVENYDLQQFYNITGFPTLLYFTNGKVKHQFGGDMSTKEGIVQWMKNPQPPKETPEEIEEDPWSKEMFHLTDDTFDEFVSQTPSVLVMFYAPWCGHCKKMKGDIMEAVKRLKKDGVAGVIAAVDATKDKNLATQYEIKGFPTVKYFKDGKFAWDFHERTAEELVAFMKDPKEPPAAPPAEQPWPEVQSDVFHLTSDNFKNELKKRKHAIVMFYAPWCGHCKMAKPEYMKAAARYKDDSKIMFGAMDCTTATDICQQYEVAGYPTFKYFNYLKTVAPYEGGRQELDFINFMAHQIDPSAPTAPKTSKPDEAVPEPWDPAVHLLTPETFEKTLSGLQTSLVMFFAPWCGHCKKAKPEFIEAAKTVESGSGFAAIDCSSNAEFCQKHNVQGYPTFHIYEKGQFKSAYEGQRSKDAFVDAVRGKVEAKPKEEKKDEDVWDSAVVRLTSETFQALVEKAERALVMFYAPWCGHCKKAKPAFVEAAKGVNTGQILAAIDCSQHTEFCRDKGVNGYPTMQMYENGKFAKTYSGDRSKESFVKFLNSKLEEAEKRKEEL